MHNFHIFCFPFPFYFRNWTYGIVNICFNWVLCRFCLIEAFELQRIVYFSSVHFVHSANLQLISAWLARKKPTLWAMCLVWLNVECFLFLLCFSISNVKCKFGYRFKIHPVEQNVQCLCCLQQIFIHFPFIHLQTTEWALNGVPTWL